MGPVALARMVNGIAVAARRGAERNSGSLISRARGMRQKAQGGQFWAIEMEVSLSNTDSSEVPQEGRPMVEAETAIPEVVSSKSN
ncbi:hypothetical protein FOZ63_028085 [Perkinsus olseni]|uniref:Uncharacterized protein n=1 Tax=Perkinsus olseni TaxID=32597 RepID=A0A7J6Q2I6_PEROL|nr:hypothetical protein FOZ63_028085 [Perkinsus olseni]